MRKLIAVLEILVLLLCCACASAEEETVSPDPEGLAFDSCWVGENLNVHINPEEEGFRVMITRMDDYPHATCWEYSALYNAETKTLETMPFGRKSTISYTEDGTFEFGETEYEDGSASFALDGEGFLIWTDEKEDAGKGIRLEKIGWFDDTTWVCDRASIEMFWEEEGYKVYVEWGSSAWESTVWMYSCTYDARTNSLVGFGSCENLVYGENSQLISSEEVYDFGEVSFTLNEDGGLLWHDEMENAGQDMVFLRLDY